MIAPATMTARPGVPAHETAVSRTLVALTQPTALGKKATLKTQGEQVNPVERTTFRETEYQHLLRTWK